MKKKCGSFEAFCFAVQSAVDIFCWCAAHVRLLKTPHGTAFTNQTLLLEWFVYSGSSPRWEYFTSGYQIHPLMGLNLRYHFLSQKYIAEKMKYTNMSSRMGCSYWYLSIFYICVQKSVMCTANFRPSSKRAIFMTCLGLYWNKKLVLNLFPWYWNSNTIGKYRLPVLH